MRFEKLDEKKHNSHLVAELICETDKDIFTYLFKNKSVAAQKLEKLILAGNNSMGYEHIIVGVENDKIRGILLYSCGAGHHKLSELMVLFRNLNIWDALKFLIIDLKDSLILSDLQKGDFYLAGIAVDHKCRGRGIGSQILHQAILMAQNRQCHRLVLDVALSNARARKLYEKTGFQIFGKKSFPWFGRKIGMYNMEMEIFPPQS